MNDEFVAPARVFPLTMNQQKHSQGEAKKARQLAHLDASDLILWKVKLPRGQSQS